MDYKQARIKFLSIRIRPDAELARRGGRVAVAVVPLTEQKVQWYRPSRTYGANWKTTDSVPFDQIVQLPGAVLSPASSPMSVGWRPKSTEYGFRVLQMGIPDTSNNAETRGASAGSDLVVEIYIGYRDFAS
jgi:hypothetical protein